MSIVFDTEALLAFYLGEPGGKKVEKHLRRIMEGESRGFLSIINLTEFYYILHRRSPDLAGEKEMNLRGYGLEVVPVDDDTIWREAAKTKAGHTLSLADAFAVATAREKNASLLVGRDPEFNGLGVPLERVS